MRRILLTIILALTLTVVADSSSEWNRSCSVSGGSPQRLSTVISTCGYTGTYTASQRTIKNPSNATNSVYVGQSDVNATNGYEIEPGTASTRAAISTADPLDLTQVYLYVPSTQTVSFSIIGR